MKSCASVFLFLLVALSCPAQLWAFDTPATDPKVRDVIGKAGEGNQPVASLFGCDKFAWGNLKPGGNIMALEYVPLGDTAEGWTRMMTAILYQLPGDPAKNKELVRALQASLLAQYSKGISKIIATENYSTSDGYTMIYINYEIGAGAQKEHNAGVFLHPTADGRMAGFFQIQSRGDKDIDDADIAKLKKLVKG
jgi:hypothetical protein